MSSTSETPTANPTRELAAIMFRDIAGYTLIMGRDEQQAIRALAAHRELLRDLLPRFKGRMLGEIGDGTLSSFHSAVDAVNCAREVQAALKNDPALAVRIGIHVGDVIFSPDNRMGRRGQYRVAYSRAGGARRYLHFRTRLRRHPQQA